MENIFIIIVGILFLLAISDLVVGVSNDAVNFLNSAIGAKAAPFWIIMIVASLGIVFGATFSDGMMEVARKGIFHPEHFYLSEIMIIFLAVMITDVILLDMFNTFGLPTSTTVSIVFELLGAAVAISIIKINKLGLDLSEIGTYINSAKALAITSGILLSVVVAFVFGAVIQFITRLVFSFDYQKTIKYFGAIWGGVAVTAITYFLIIKGAKGSSLISGETLIWIKANSFYIILLSFIGWTVILQALFWIFRLDILKLTVLLGTFALAMAFAGNDLVNFIGVPLAGLKSVQAFIADPNATDPDSFAMVALTGKVKTETILLLIAGFIMVITLWLSRKARSVTATTLDLSRQGEGNERFGSSFFSRSIVRSAINFNHIIRYIIPKKVQVKINRRFDQKYYKSHSGEGASPVSFDMLRASVNLVVASIIISFATSLKLPLSTTYVTFMVAMGSSLSDGAWGRESAVYRITGVFTVIGGWFFTAFSAFTVAFLVAYIIHLGGTIAIFLLVIIAATLIYRTHILFNKKEAEKQKLDTTFAEEMKLEDGKIINKCQNNVHIILDSVLTSYDDILNGIFTENRKLLKHAIKEINVLNKNTKRLKDNIYNTITKLQEDSVESGHYYVQVLDYLREIVHCISFISRPVYEHVENNHKGLLKAQIKELKDLKEKVTNIILQIQEINKTHDFSKIDTVINNEVEFIETVNFYRKKQIKRIKKEVAGTKNSLLYLSILTETKNLILHSINLLKSYRDFVLNDDKK
ncbi:MAG: inorganic phosphate transporter [Bacteroidales bacterium]|nr:inorganic phosphate transporter [Bacteroidales bacterium]